MPRELLTVPLPLLRQRTSIKWRLHPEDVLPLWVAEMDVLPAPPVVEAIERASRLGDHGYPVASTYLEAVARWYQGFGVETEPAAARLVPDVMTGIEHTIRAVTPGDGAVVITTPVYTPFHSVVRDTGRRLVTAPLSPFGRLDPTTLQAALVDAGPGSALLLSNPHNPTGAVHTPDELRTALRLAAEHDVTVISDEIHAPLVLPGADFTSVLALDEGDAALVLVSAAKGWNLAAFKAAAVVPGRDAHALAQRVPVEAGYHASHIAVQAHVAAMDEGQDWLSALVRDLDANRTLLGELVREHLPGVSYRPHEGTYLAWLDCRETGLGDDPAEAFLREGRVALNAGHTFGPEGAGHVRVNIATSPEILSEAVERMARVL